MLRNISLQKKLLLVVSMPLIIMMCMIGVIYRIGTSLEEAVEKSIHSQTVLHELEVAWRGLVAIHSECFQLALLGSTDMLTTVEDTELAARTALRTLTRLTADNEKQHAAAREIARLGDDLLSALAHSYKLLKDHDEVLGREQAAKNERSMQKLASRVFDFENTESHLAFERLHRRQELSLQLRYALLLGGACCLPIIGLFGWALLGSVMRRLQVIQRNLSRFASDGELMRAVPARDEIGVLDRVVHDIAIALRTQQRDNEMFIYSVSHDLRSPLVTLQGFSKELARSIEDIRQVLHQGDTPPEVLESFEVIANSDIKDALHFIDLAAHRQERIIKSLLRLSRAGSVEYTWKDISLQKCIDSLAETLRAREAPQGLTVAVGELPDVRGDESALERVFDNLLDNAFKFLSPERPGVIAVEADEPERGYVVIRIKDNGIGLPPDGHERAFTPFARLSGGEGEGIGLSLVRRTVERHHGKVWIESEHHRGTTVCVRLPLATGEAASQRPGPKAPSSADRR